MANSRRRLAVLIVPVVGAAVAVVTAAGPSESAGDSPPEPRPVATAPTPEPIEGTTWRLVGFPQQTDVTLRIAEGRFTLRSCNLMVGQVTATAERLVLHNEWAPARRCGRVDTLLHEAAQGPFRLHREPGGLRLVSAATGATLRFRAPESPQPPLDAVQVGELDGPEGNCRVLAATTERGPRLYVLARTRYGGPWRMLPGGPVGPETGAVRTRALNSLTPGSKQTCVVGLGPAAYVRSVRA